MGIAPNFSPPMDAAIGYAEGTAFNYTSLTFINLPFFIPVLHNNPFRLSRNPRKVPPPVRGHALTHGTTQTGPVLLFETLFQRRHPVLHKSFVRAMVIWVFADFIGTAKWG